MSSLVKFGKSWIDPTKVIAAFDVHDMMIVYTRCLKIHCRCDSPESVSAEQWLSVVEGSGRHYSQINDLSIDPKEVVAITIEEAQDSTNNCYIFILTEQHKIKCGVTGSLVEAEQWRNAFSAIICAARLMSVKEDAIS
jgi:hypothetical protein